MMLTNMNSIEAKVRKPWLNLISKYSNAVDICNFQNTGKNTKYIIKKTASGSSAVKTYRVPWM